jgi:hypothetical protein
VAKLNDSWKVLPHGPLVEVEPGLLTVVGQIPMPLGNFPRRMTVAALGRNRTAIFSPIALGDDEMTRIEALGMPAFLIVPNAAHRLDLRPFRARYPKAKIVTSPGAKRSVEEVVKPVQLSADLGGRADIVVLAGCNGGEIALLVRGQDGTTLITNDVVGNIAHPQGLGARVMARLMGFGPRPRITRPAKWFFIKDKAALAEQLREWAELDDLRRLIPSHGDIIERPAAVLRRLADDL